MNDNSIRLRARRQMAQACMILVWAIVIAVLWGLTDDKIADRALKLSPILGTIFAALMGYVGWYAKLGSDENKHAVEINKGA